MFSFGEYVFNQNTGHIGRVIGRRHEKLKNCDRDAMILKVLVDYAETSGKRGIVEEDLDSAWSKWQHSDFSPAVSLTRN